MELSKLLSLAQNYRKEREWEKAIECYEQYLQECKDMPPFSVYKNYAQSLIRKGDINRAKEILLKAKEVFPNNERVLIEIYKLYDFIGEWENAKIEVNELITLNPGKSEYYFLLGRIYSFLDSYKEAKNIYKKGIECRHNCSIEEVINRIQCGITNNPTEIKTEYVLSGGRNNYGAFIHNIGEKKFFTKITNFGTRDARREEAFYKDILMTYPALRKLVPQFVDSKVIDNVLYLTSEMIEETPISSEQLMDVINAMQRVSTIKSSKIVEKYPNPNYLFQMKNRAISIVIFFTQIHKRSYNEQLFKLLYKLLNQNNYPKSVMHIINRLEALIMDNKLYALINPEEHYSLLHGDMIKPNIKNDGKEKDIKIFDWATFTTGPHFIDIARYLSDLLIPYSEIKDLYLNNPDTGENLSIVEKIFFNYSLILLYIMRLKEKDVEKRLNDCILPCLTDLEFLIENLDISYYKNAIQRLSLEKEEVESSNAQLEEQLLKLEKNFKEINKVNKSMRIRHENMINSKSWKLTKPLRKLIERKKK